MELLWQIIGVMFGMGISLIVLVIGALGLYLALVTIQTIIEDNKKKKGAKKNDRRK